MTPEKIQNTAVALYNTKPGTKAIDVRREMVQIPEVARTLNNIEKYIFAASTKILISEIDDATLVEKTKQLFKFIAMDVGYIIPKDAEEWMYIQTRLLDIIKRYYSDMTLADIKLAFELSTTGQLDEYLPRDSQGNPDRKHYQQFNADYFSKILKAYKLKQNNVFDKAYKALPKPQAEINPEVKTYYHNQRLQRNRYIYLKYKYTGIIELEFSDEMFIFAWLINIGFADNVEATEEDRKTAYKHFFKRVANGFVNKDKAFNVRRKGIDSPDIDFTAYEIARKKEIIRAFDRMIQDEIQIDNYLIYG